MVTSMRRSPKLQFCGWDVLVVFVILFLAGCCAVMVWGNRGDSRGLIAVVSIEGKIVERIDLETLDVPTQNVYCGNGYTICVNFSVGNNRGVWVESSDCPTQDCVHTGMIKREGESIVCLPARVAIQLQGTDEGQREVDAVVG